jgi:hypothetical protein
MTLRDFLIRSKAPLKSAYYFKDDDLIKKKKPKPKSSPQSKNKSAQKNTSKPLEEDEN